MTFNIYRHAGILLMLILFIFTAQQGFSKNEFTKTYTKSFHLSNGGKVNIENMHGQVNITTWDKDEVYIKVTVKVDASSESKAEDGFDRIKIDFSNDDRYVSAKTSIDSKKSSWWFIQSWWVDDDVEIDYVVSMPADAKLELSHRYGNAELANFSDNVMVNLKYGDLKIDQVAGNLVLDLSYGNAVIAKANMINADIAYFKLRMNEVNSLNIYSKYSQVYVESANEIISESSYDGYHLGDVGKMKNTGKYDNIDADKIKQLDIITKYTKINLEYLLQRLNSEMSYGGLEIDRLDLHFESIEINSRYAGLEINTNNVPEYKLDVECKYTSVHYPANITTTRDQKEDNRTLVIGHRGSSGAKGLIKVRGDYGGLKIL